MKNLTLTLTNEELEALKGALARAAEEATNPVLEEALDNIYEQVEKQEA